jgi:hypothetical protein
LAAEESGKLSAIDGTGALRWTAELGVRPVVARIQARALPGAGAVEPAPPLTMQLVDAALNPDTRLVPARALAVSMLANQEEEEATAALIELCQDRTTPERVRKVACVALAKRTNGSDAIAAALDRHANYLTQTKAPPVGPLAEAAMRNGDAQVVPKLLAHLTDPATPADELPALMLALKQLATLEHAPPIAEFMRLYHADGDEPGVTGAVIIAIGTLAKLQGSAAQGQLEAIASDGLAPAPVRAAASQALAGLAEQAPTAGGTEPAEAAARAGEPVEDEVQDEGPPEHRTALHLERALRPVAVPLSKCVRDAPKRPNSARLSVVLDGSGNVIALETLPAELKVCMEPLVRKVSYPANKFGRRETLTHTITR